MVIPMREMAPKTSDPDCPPDPWVWEDTFFIATFAAFVCAALVGVVMNTSDSQGSHRYFWLSVLMVSDLVCAMCDPASTV
jgi:hypothetical protein